MQKYLLLLFILSFSTIDYAQVIKITCHDSQQYTKSGFINNPNKILTAPDYKTEKIIVDCDYVINLQEKTLFFESRSNPGSFNRQLNISQFNTDEFIISYADGYIDNPMNSQFDVLLFLNTQKETFEYLYYDKLSNSTTVYPTGKITMTVNHNL